MSIVEISAVLKGKLFTGIPVCITEYSIDSRSIINAEQTLFFALKGKHHNAHDYVQSLYANGVRAFVVDECRPDFDALQEANFIQVLDVLAALQLLAATHRRHIPAEIVAITGSNGKTIVKEWIHQLLASRLNLYRSPRSYNSQVGVPLSLLGIPKDASLALIEAGISQPGEMERLQRMISPDIGIFTHLGAAHDEHFQSREEKLREKARLFTSCHTLIGEAGEALDFIRRQLPRTTRFITWGSSPECTVRVHTLHLSQREREVEILHDSERFTLTIPFADTASFENVMQAVCFLLLKKVPISAIQEGVKQLSAIAMRMEIKEGINHCVLINDYYNSDPAAFQLALNTLAMQDPGKERVVILSDFLDSGKDQDFLYQQVAHLLRQARVSQFIGIGPCLEQHRHYFAPHSRFYADTEHFLRQEQRDDFHDQVILIKGARSFRFEFIAGFLQKQSHSTVLEVDLDAMTHNLNHFRSLTPARIAVMVKACSYGSGSVEIASLLQYHRVDYLMVAFADEGIELRAAGITLPIAVMNPEPEAFDNMVLFNLEPEIHSLAVLEAFEQALAKHGVKRFPIHVKLNTGMNRSGFDEHELPALLHFFDSPRTVYIKTLFSHLAGSDEAIHDNFTLEQIHLFTRLSEEIQSRFPHKIWRHILNSAGIERFPEYHFDMVRLGIGLHGISAVGTPLLPVSTFKTHITAIREVPAGISIGYGRRGYTTRPTRIAVIPVGYADGLNRHLSHGVGSLFLKGQRVPIIGNICMDSCMLDVTDTTATLGDEVEIFGRHLLVSDLANKLNTIPYEVLTSVSPRVKRIYYKE